MARALAARLPHAAAPAVLARRPVAPLLALATLLAAALRLPFLGTQSLWFDETYTVTSCTARWASCGSASARPSRRRRSSTC
jgi:hypothetical protein